MNDNDVGPAQAVVAPDDYDSDSNSDDNEEQPYSEEEKAWTGDASTHDRYAFPEEHGPHADIQDSEGPVDYFELFFQ